MDGKKEGWMKDGTKTDNGICILTMPTWNYFISLWNMKLTLKFLPIARFGHYEFTGRGPML